MSLEKLDRALEQEIQTLRDEGRAKAPERVIVGYIAPRDGMGPRYKLEGQSGEYIRMNSNAYLSLALHPELIHAADTATHEFGVGPGAVRFIDGTFRHHVELERRIARFTGKPAAKIFNSAYTSNCGLALAVSDKDTFWIGDQLNHNSIIRGMRIAGIPKENRAIYAHNDMADLERCLKAVPAGIKRVLVIFDGIFSMRGDCAPIDKIVKICREHEGRFEQGVFTVVDDSHGIGAYGATGRGTPDHTGAQPDIIIGTFGKAFSVNGGFIAGSATLIEAVRQRADTYIYTNPLSVADCAAATKAIDICDSPEGRDRLANLKARIKQFRDGITRLGLESIDGPHPVVPVLVRDTGKTQRMVRHLYDKGILAVGLTFPVVPKGDETIRFQINAAHTAKDIDQVLAALDSARSA